jgi:hypothetical protein
MSSARSKSLLPIISRAEAKRRGLKRFFTGKPCKHGHVCERIVCANNKCVQCKSERNLVYRVARGPTPQQREEAQERKLAAQQRQQEAQERKLAAQQQRREELERQRAPREQARQQGLKRYFTGVPCKRGHVCERMVLNNSCIECLRIRERARPHRDRPMRKVWSRIYRARPDIIARERAYKQRPDVKARNQERKRQPKVREQARTYRRRPDVKARGRVRSQVYRQRPEVKARHREYTRAYNQPPEVKARKNEYLRAYNQRPEVKAWMREYKRTYYQRPKVKDWMREYGRAYNQRPEVKAWRREYTQSYSRRLHVAKRRQQRDRLQRPVWNKGQLALNYLKSIGAGHLSKNKQKVPRGLSPIEKKQEYTRRRYDKVAKALFIFRQLGLTGALDIPRTK